MKKSLFFLSCIIGLLTLAGCSKDDSAIDSGNNTKSTKIRWYGVNTSDEISTRGVADESKLWNPKGGIAIKFINNPAKTDMIEKIKIIIAEWEHYAGIRFKFVDNSESASVRIAFDWQGNDWLTWSYTGTDAKYVRGEAEPTAVFGGLQYQDEEQFRGDVLRVFGQILGLEYEQRHQDWTFWRDEVKLQRYWEDMFDGMNMDWDEIKDYVFTPLSGDNAISPNQTPDIDDLSIMAWPYYARTQTTKLLANYELSEGDKAFIATLYPKSEETLPTIQEAWVDAGYFEWTDNTKTALKITKLGADQEYLPDVSDGEQLTSANSMFYLYNDINVMYYESSLVRAPMFNTSNITNFNEMFWFCTNLESIPKYDTSKGTNFRRMFTGSSIRTIPLIDTSNGIDFIMMFEACMNLESTPLLNTSKGIDFSGMFRGVHSLKNIPLLDTSNGTNFCGMFEESSIASIPLLNTSKGTDFSWMFSDCKSLNTIPLLDTSNGNTFRWMFEGSSIASIPLLNTSKGTDFSWMFSDCKSLNTVPLLDTSKGTDFSMMFNNCANLTSIPNINTSNGREFQSMFGNCTSLQQKPNLDLSSATSTNGMYYGTPFAKDLL